MLHDAAFRRAIAWAIDREACAAVWDGFAAPGYGIYPEDGWPASFDPYFQPSPDAVIGYEPSKAEELLDEAGTRTRTTTASASTRANTSCCGCGPRRAPGRARSRAELIAGWLRDVGIKVEYAVKGEPEIQKRMHKVELVESCAGAAAAPGRRGAGGGRGCGRGGGGAGRPVVKPVFAPDYDLVIRARRGPSTPGSPRPGTPRTRSAG